VVSSAGPVAFSAGDPMTSAGVATAPAPLVRRRRLALPVRHGGTRYVAGVAALAAAYYAAAKLGYELEFSGPVAAIVRLPAGIAFSAIVGSLSLRAGGVVTTGDLPDVARTWWLGDVAGAVVTVPLSLAWYRPQAGGWARGRSLEAVLMLAAVAGLSQLAFGTA